MARVTNELIFEGLERLQHDPGEARQDIRDVKTGIDLIRGRFAAVYGETTNIYGILARQNQRLDRIERRPELRELAEPQHPFEPHP